MKHHVFWRQPDISEEHVAFIFKVKQKPGKKPEEADSMLNSTQLVCSLAYSLTLKTGDTFLRNVRISLNYTSPICCMFNTFTPSTSAAALLPSYPFLALQ
jgi:hypothetical protein